MKRVLIIYTGGTIGMTRTENGYAPRAGYFRAALDAIPDLRAPETARPAPTPALATSNPRPESAHDKPHFDPSNALPPTARIVPLLPPFASQK